MAITRRQLIQQLAALGALSHLPAQAALLPRIIPWRNWSGAQMCLPQRRVAPGSEAELADLIRAASGEIRPVGAGHSFSALVPTDGTIVTLARMSGLISHDAQTLQAEFHGGTPMSQMGAALERIGQAFFNMADVDYQTFAGAVSTSTHGTGQDLGSYSDYVTGLRLVSAHGEIIDCDAQNKPEIFQAARVSMGALGIISRIRMQNRKPYRLKEHMWLAKTEDLLDDLPRLLADNDRWEMQVITNSDFAASITLNETDDPPTPGVDEMDSTGNEYVEWIRKADKYGSDLPRARRALLNAVARTANFDPRVGESYDIFANVRDVRFNEMEYSVPAEAGPACLREILHAINSRRLPTWFPIEYRYVKADDIPISMFEGRDSCAISIHQHYTMDYHEYFGAIEKIFWKYDGRPHWGKLHKLNARYLEKLYPRWREFTEVREALDPTGKFLNAHLRSVFGVSA